MSGFLQTWFFVASFIPWFLIDRIGRRPLLLSMISVMAAVMAVQAALIYQVQFDTSMAKSAGIAAAAMLFVFQGAFTIGFQATVWVYPSEILPLRLRQRGSAISTAANWICNYVSNKRQLCCRNKTNSAVRSSSRSRQLPSTTLAGAHISSLPFSTRPGFQSSTSSSRRPRVWSWKTSISSSRAKKLSQISGVRRAWKKWSATRTSRSLR